jgi:hypothetical protein
MAKAHVETIFEELQAGLRLWTYAFRRFYTGEHRLRCHPVTLRFEKADESEAV